MHPVWIFECWGRFFVLQAYGVLYVLAVSTSTGLALWLLRRRAMPMARSALCLFAMALTAVVGARLLHIILHGDLYAENPARLYAFSWRGFSLFGGLLLGLPAGWMAARRLHLDFWRFCDVATPALGVGIAIARAGCFMAGCCYGLPTDLPWGVTFPSGSSAHLHQILTDPCLFPWAPQPVHPTQLYEAAATLSGAALAAFLLARNGTRGVACASFALLYASARWGVFLLRPQPESATLPLFQPVLYASIMLVSGGFLLALRFSPWSHRNRKRLSGLPL